LLKQRDSSLKISHDSLKQLEKLSDIQTGKEIQLTKQFSVFRDRDHYVIKEQKANNNSPVKLEYSQLETSAFENKNITIALDLFEKPDYGNALYMDPQKITWPLTLRRWREGDRFQPFGMEGHQQVSDHLTNRKISAAHKKQALVIESFDKSICAVIFPPIKNQTQPGTISELVKCDSQTKYCVKIKNRT